MADWQLADRLDRGLIDARDRLIDRLETAGLHGLAASVRAGSPSEPLGISEPRHQASSAASLAVGAASTISAAIVADFNRSRRVS